MTSGSSEADSVTVTREEKDDHLLRRADGPLVSAIVLCYNHAPYVIETLDSVRSQTYPHLQLIIIDDCSRDGSPERIQHWIRDHDVRCELILHSENHGICRTLNEALRLSRGEFIAIVAADDIWLPDKIRLQLSIFDGASPDLGVVYTDAWRIGPAGEPLHGMFIESHRSFDAMPSGFIQDTLVDGNFIPALTTLIRKCCFDRVGTYDERLSYEDWDMWLRIASAFTFAFSPRPSGLYRVLPTSLSHRLFHGTTARNTLRDKFLILEKCLTNPNFSTQARDSVKRQIATIAERLYVHRVPSRLFLLWRALRITRSARSALLLLGSTLHVPYSVFSRIDALHTSWSTRHSL